MKRRRNADDRLRRAQREALASQDLLLAYEAAAYAEQTGDLASEGTYNYGEAVVQTPNGPLVVRPTFNYYGWYQEKPSLHTTLVVSSRERSYGFYRQEEPLGYYTINGRDIDIRLDFTYPELNFHADVEPRRVTHGRDPLPPARRAQIANQVRSQILPWVAANAAHIHACAVNYMKRQVAQELQSARSSETGLQNMQKSAGQLYLRYLDFKNRQGYASPAEHEVLQANDVDIAYQALSGLLASGQLGLEHTTQGVREAIIPTPYGEIHVQRLPGSNIQASTLGTRGGEWKPLKVPVTLGARKGGAEIYVAFNFELSRHGYPVANQYSRAGQRSEIVFARDKIREVSLVKPAGYWHRGSKLLAPKVREQVVDLVENLVTAWAAGALDVLRKADEDIYLAQLKDAEKNILSQVRQITQNQQAAGKAYLFLLTM